MVLNAEVEKIKAMLASDIIRFVVEFLEAHELTDWAHELPDGTEEIIEAYLIPKKEAGELKTAVRLFLEKAKYSSKNTRR